MVPARGTERVDLTVVTLAATVVDRSGAAIRDLQSGDFELRVDGVPTPITNFAGATALPPLAGGGGAEPGAYPGPRYLAVLVGARGGSAQERGRALQQLGEMLPRLQAAGWRVAVAPADEEFRAVDAFTDGAAPAAPRLQELEAIRVQPSPIAAERQSLLNGMDDISIGLPGKEEGAAGLAMDTNEARGVLQRIRALARAQRQVGRAHIALLADAVHEFARLPGTRCVVWVGEGFEVQPAADLFLLWAGRYPQVALRELRKPELEAGQYSLAAEVDDLGTRAADAGVTLYYVPTSTWASGAANDVDREGAETTSDLTSSSNRALGDALADLARASGGARLAAGKRGLAALADELGARYTIGFPAPSPAGEKSHRVSLTVKRAGASVRHRESFRVRTVAERMVEVTVAALVGGAGANPLGATVERRETVERGEGRVDLTLEVTVPMRNLALVPERSAHRGEVAIFYGASTGGGGAIEVRSRSFPVLLDNQTLLTTLGSDASFTLTVTVAAGAERLSLTVLDTVSQLASTVTIAVGAGVDSE